MKTSRPTNAIGRFLELQTAGGIFLLMFAVGLLAGIGFTMSLFIGMLAFEGEGSQYAVATRAGVFAASIVSAIAGFLVLRMVLPRSAAADDRPLADDGSELNASRYAEK